jgi:5-methylcytosine-specific restriction endonuclease McrA
VKASTLVEVFSDKEIFDRDGWICGLCLDPVNPVERHNRRGPNPRAASLDHRVPLNRGGHHVRTNVRCTHQGCNARKRDRLDDEILNLFPRLAFAS